MESIKTSQDQIGKLPAFKFPQVYRLLLLITSCAVAFSAFAGGTAIQKSCFYTDNGIIDCMGWYDTCMRLNSGKYCPVDGACLVIWYMPPDWHCIGPSNDTCDWWSIATYVGKQGNCRWADPSQSCSPNGQCYCEYSGQQVSINVPVCLHP